jgi:hypothetical protein
MTLSRGLSRRFMTRTARAVVLGAITTVAVSWLIAWSRPKPVLAYSSDAALQWVNGPRGSNDEHLLYVARFRGLGKDFAIVYPAYPDTRGPEGSVQAVLEGTSFCTEICEKADRREASTAIWLAHGWPMRALSAELWWTPYGRDYVGAVKGGILVGIEDIFEEYKNFSVHDPTIVLPYKPVWSALLFNTVFYGSIWLALFYSAAGLGWVRTQVRRRRGQCMNCGYALLSGQDRCSECGAPAAHTEVTDL